MEFAPGVLARLLFGDWRVVVADDGIVAHTKQGEQKTDILLLRDVAVINWIFFARMVLTSDDGGGITLTGISPQKADALRAQIRRHYTAAAVADMKNIGEVEYALQSFYALPRYLSAFDVDKWLKSQTMVNESLAQMHYYQNRPLFDSAMTNMPAVINRFFDITDETKRKELHRRNEEFVEGQMRACAAFFDGVEKTPLTQEQRYAAVVMEDCNLLTAAAGSGKTSALVGKIGYVLHRGICRPQEIVALAFNKKAAAELRERIDNRLADLGGNDVTVATFHSLGLGIVGEADGKKPRVAEWAANLGENTNNKTEALINELAAINGKFCGLLGELYSVFRWAIKPRIAFQTQKQYDRHLEKLNADKDGERRFPTIKGDKVKSMEELAIANFLHLHGARYEYETKYEHDTADAKHGQYHPDFYYPDAGLYHEHFALDKNGKAPAFMGGAEYVRGVEWKQNLHKEKGTKLLITTSAQFNDDDFFGDLRRRLEECGVVFGEQMPPTTILGWLRSQESKPIYDLMSRFLSLWKASGKTIAELYTKAKQLSGFAHARAKVFLGAMELLREFYESKLRDKNEVDFEDMLALAAERIERGAYLHPYQLILVDEFQDISHARARLIKAMLNQRRECKLFAVGDDWQAIYRFAGADIKMMREFAAEFGKTSQSLLRQTFRSNQGISDIASMFVCQNPLQIKKTIRAADPARAGVVGVLYYKRDEDVARIIENKLATIARKSPGAKIFILGRYGLWHYKKTLTDAHIAEWQKRYGMTIAFLTMHKAKGLEADYVFILGMERGKNGFPSEREDDKLLSLVMTEKEEFAFAEERRLFYVALTRAKRQSYLLARMDSPSPFVDEINAMHKGGEVVNETDIGGKMAAVRLCPQCLGDDERQGGVLVPRNSRYGAFYGCSNWRADGSGCGYKENIKPLRG